MKTLIISGLAILAFVAYLPTGISLDGQGIDMMKPYGSATIVAAHADGEVYFEQTTHNAIVNLGENHMLRQIANINGATNKANADGMDMICITERNTFVVRELETSTLFNDDDGVTLDNCLFDEAVVTAASAATDVNTAVWDVTFTAGTDMDTGDTVTGIGIGQIANNADGPAFTEDNFSLLATIDIGDVTPGTNGDTLQIVYTLQVT